ncbi:MAG: phage tail sheath subtilisin-like domain-containing protein [Sphingorhabdus sp.]
MPEYLAPAVFVEETSFRAKSIEGVGTSTAAFVGLTARGPVSQKPSDPTPPLLTNFNDFERYYGGVDDLTIGGKPTPNFLAMAVQAFFSNGGGRLYVSRILGTGASKGAAVVLNNGNPAANKRVSVFARKEGGAKISGGDANFRVTLVETLLETTKKLALKQPAGTMIKIGNEFFVVGISPVLGSGANINNFNNAADSAAVKIVTIGIEVQDPTGNVYEAAAMGLHPEHPRYIGVLLGANPPQAIDALTNPIEMTIGAVATPFEVRAALMHQSESTDNANVDVRQKDLKGGSDGTGGPAEASYKEALQSLLALEDVSIVAAPGSSSFSGSLPALVNQALIGHAEARRSYRIAVLDSPPKLELAGVKAVKSKIDSKYAALYYPWITVGNPMSATNPLASSLIDVPPSGAVCGIYARSDIQRGVWKAPANETVTGAVALQRDVRFGEQEVLNPLGINCVRSLPNRGIRVWGARTLSSDPEWKYVNIRRYFLYLEASIDRGTQWAVFEPNGEDLWTNIRTTVSDFLYNEWVSGALLGASPKEAFFVHCDRTTMTQNDLDNGRLICQVGVAALKPAEFVIFRIGQKTADAAG